MLQKNKLNLITIVSSLMVSNAFAEERLDTLMLKPATGQLITKLSYTQSKKDFSEYVLGAPSYDSKELKTKTGSVTFDYGYNDKLNVFVISDYTTEDTTTFGSSEVAKSDGFENPLFGLKYRFLEEETQGFNFDVMVPFSFDMIDSEAADASTHVTGTVADGRDTVGIRLDAGKYYGDIGVLFSAGAEYKDDKSTYDSSSGTNNTATSSTDYTVGAEIQYVQPLYSVNLSYVYKFVGSYRDEDNSKFNFDDITAYFAKVSYSQNPTDYSISLTWNKADAGNIEAVTALGTVDYFKNIDSETWTIMYMKSF